MATSTILTLPGRSSIKSRVLHLHDEVRYSWLGDQASTRPPISIEIHLTNRCNLTCSFCTYGQVRHNETLPAAMLEDLVADLVAAAPTLGAVMFSGGGEPTLHRGLPAAIHRLVDAGIDVGIITNAVRITPALHDALRRVTWVRVSLDTPHPDRYQAVMAPRRPGYFHQVLRNLARLNAARTQRSPITGIGYIIDRHSQDDASLLRCLDLAAETGADYIMYRPLVGIPDLAVTRPQGELAALIPGLAAYAQRVGVAEQYAKFVREQFGSTAAQAPHARDARCPIVNDGLVAFIAATGVVYPCYARYMNSGTRNDIAGFGDLADERFTAIWHGPLRQQVIAAIDATRCPHCRFQGHNFLLWDMAEDRPSPDYQIDPNDPHRRFL